MFSVIFEVHPRPEQWDAYLGNAKMLRPELEQVDGFVDNIRYKSLTRKGWILSLSGWRDEKSVVRWRTFTGHHMVQEKGRSEILLDYHLRVGQVTRDTLTGWIRLAEHLARNHSRDMLAFTSGATAAIGRGAAADLITLEDPLIVGVRRQIAELDDRFTKPAGRNKPLIGRFPVCDWQNEERHHGRMAACDRAGDERGGSWAIGGDFALAHGTRKPGSARANAAQLP